jgi:hypothetical protein
MGFCAFMFWGICAKPKFEVCAFDCSAFCFLKYVGINAIHKTSGQQIW